MMPYIFKIGSFELRIYSLMIIIGLLIVILFSRWRAKKLGLKAESMENIIILIFIFAIIGTRAYYVLFNWGYYGKNLSQIFAIWNGGLAIHGGVIAGTIGAYIVAKYYKTTFFFLADILTPLLLFAQGLGRIGNFANGEAHGVPTITPPSIIFRVRPIFNEFWQTTLNKFGLSNTPEGVSKLNDIVHQGNATVDFNGVTYPLNEYVSWGISFTDKYMPAAYLEFGRLAVHPTFFYEMILNFLGAFILILFWRKDKFIGSGVIFGGYLVAYGLIRGFVTTFRADDLMLSAFRAPHIVSVCFILLGLFFILNGKKNMNKKITLSHNSKEGKR